MEVETSHINLSYLIEMSDNSPGFVKEIANIFKSQIPIFNERFETCIKNKDLSEFKKIAHKAKCAVGVMGMVALEQKLKIIDDSQESVLCENDILEVSNLFREVCDQALLEIDEAICKMVL